MRKLLFIAFVLATVGVFAQQDAQFTQYMNNKIFINQAAPIFLHTTVFPAIKSPGIHW